MASSTREGVRPPRDALVSWLARLYGHRLTTTTGGNLSMLDDDGTFYVTPSGGDKAFVPPSDVAVLRPGRSRGGSDGIDGVGADGDGNDATTAANFEGPRPPSIEWPLHAAVYRARPNYRAVLHAHSPTLVAFSLARQRQQPETQVADTNCSRCSTSRRAADAAATTALATGDTTSDDSGLPETRCLLSAWQSCGRVVLAPYEIPGTNELADGCAAAFATGADCVILQNHGVVTAGVTMREAYDRFVSLEYLAQSIVHALPLGPLRLLPERLLRASRPDAAAAAFEHISKRPRLLSPSSSVGRDRHGGCGIDFGSATVERCSTCCTRVLSGEEKESRAELCKFVSRAYSQNIVTASSGSFSLRVTGGQMKGGRDGVVDGVANPCPAHTSGGGCGDGAVAPSFLVTPTDVDRGSLAPADVCFVSTEMSSDDPRLDPAGGPGGCGPPSTNPPRSKGGNHGGASPSRSRSKLRWHPLHQRQLDFAPSRASAVHGAIYAAHPGVGCVMIVQPPHATAYCITGHAFNAAGIPEAYLVLRDVQILSIEDALLGDDNFSSVVKVIDPENGRHTILISGYGLLTVAADPLKAFVQVEVCEAMCGVVLTAMRRGPVKLLSGNEIDAIDRKFGIESAKKPSSAANRPSVECSEFETRLFINNQFVHSASRKTFDTINPATTEIICSVQEAQEVDVDRAVAAAKKAFQPGSPWRRASGSDRRNLLLRLADLIERDRDYLEQLESLDNGKPLGRGVCYGSAVDLHLVLQCYRYFAGWADKIMGNTIPVDGDMLCYTRKEPVGICGCIIPWNFPLLMMAWKLAPALACGNTVVLKTSEKTPLSALHIGKLAKEAGFPAGVVNVLSGFGTPAGEALARHMDVDKVAFTGSTRVGKLIEAYAAQSNLKNVSLECGGKSPLIVFDDADMDIALVAAHNGLFLNQGQCCCASSRIYVHEAIYDKFVEAAVNKAEKIEVGAFDSDSVEHGPQVDKIQFDHVLSYIKKGVAEGAKLASGGGPHPLYRKKGGYFLQPTVFKDVTDDMTIAKEEIFGPVMCILKFKTDDEVIKRANGTIYGLAAGIISNNGRRAISAAHQIRAGTVWINTYNAFDSAAPFGGLKQSGHGRDCGYESLSSWLETKTIMMPLNHNAK